MKIPSRFKKRVTRDDIIWCYRTLLNREPESEAAIQDHAKSKSLKDLVESFVHDAEYISKRGVQKTVTRQSAKVVSIGKPNAVQKEAQVGDLVPPSNVVSGSNDITALLSPKENKALAMSEFKAGVLEVRSTPSLIALETTSRCNLRCVMCPHAINAVDRPKHLEPELVAGLETYLRQSHTIQLHGIGEPLASPAFWESLKFLPTDCESSINTNLVVLDDGRLQALLDSNLRAINVSLDAARPATYQKIRGHSFDAVIANMHRLIAARKVRARFPQLQMNMTLMRSNIEEVLEFIDLAADLGADKIWLWHLNKWSESEMKRYIVERDGWVFDYEKEGLWNFPELSNQYLRKAEARARERGVLLAMDHNKTVYFDESGVSHV